MSNKEYDEINDKFHYEHKLNKINRNLECLKQLGEAIMSVISKFVDLQNAFNDKMDLAIAGLQGDIKALNDEILKLQNSQGEISVEDQASLDLLQSRGLNISEKLDALDALTPPVPPVNG